MPDKSLRNAILAVVALGLLAAVWILRPSTAKRLRNLEGRSVLIVMIDTLRSDYLGAYGFDGDISPNLDRFAAESILFERCVAPAPWTTPSIASLFLSRYPETHQVVVFAEMFRDEQSGVYQTNVLPGQATTLAEEFQRAGYTTAGFVANPWIGARQGFARGFDSFLQGKDPRVVAAASEWLQTATEPFFVYIHSMTVHGPYEPQDQDVEVLRASRGVGESEPLSDEQVEAINWYLKQPAWAGQPEAKDVREWRIRYAAQVREFDRQFGELIEGLRASGRLDDTLVIVMGDHGEELGEHGGWDHGKKLHGHQLRVPLLIRLPGFQGGDRIKNAVSLVDIRPTLIDAVGIPGGEALDGRSLLPLIAGQAGGQGDRAVYASGVKGNTKMRAVVDGRYKLIRDGATGTTRLFDTASDPGELHDLAGQEPDLVAAGVERLRAYEAAALLEALESETTDVPEELLEKLKSLGYVE